MSENWTVEVNDDDKPNSDEFNENKPENSDIKPHNSKPITRIEISPKSEYLVTYSENDHSIVGWDVKDDKYEGQLVPDPSASYNLIETEWNFSRMCVSDKKELAFSYYAENSENPPVGEYL